jgi:hypothetical protein
MVDAVDADDGDARPSRNASDVSERALGRTVAGGLPALVLVGALTMGLTVGIGPALLVLAGGALLGTISLLWASLRTLSGDAPLAESLLNAGTASLGPKIGVAERKREALRAIKDIEFEHSVGKIDDADYTDLVARYRGEAKAILREMDVEIEPYRERAEDIARAYLAKRGAPGPAPAPAPAADATSDEPEPTPGEEAPARSTAPSRVPCPRCDTSNEPDAAFCKKCGAAVSSLERNDSDVSA